MFEGKFDVLFMEISWQQPLRAYVIVWNTKFWTRHLPLNNDVSQHLIINCSYILPYLIYKNVNHFFE